MQGKRFHIGCQSWGYDDWVTPPAGPTVFYPNGTDRGDMLALYSRVFSTIEVDATLYGVPPLSTYEKWYAETPDDFIFSLKFPREITHDLRLRGNAIKVAREFVDRSESLKEKLGLFLVQFPAAFEADRDNAAAFRTFLAELPAGRFAIEFRDASWLVDWTFEAIENAGCSLCLVEGPWIDREKLFAIANRVKSPFQYYRMMGTRDLPRFDRIRRHRDDVIDLWAAEMQKTPASDVYVYVDNYFEGHAPTTAGKFMTRLGLDRPDPTALEVQPSLFTPNF